jgi:hypothetical protein
MSLAGCTWHLETEPVTYPSASATTLERDSAANREQSIMDALNVDYLAAGTDLATFEALVAPAHLEALGGVYLATPSPAPSPSAYHSTLDAAVAAARDWALETSLATPDHNLALLQSSVGISHAFGLWWDENSGLAPSSDALATPAPSDADSESAEESVPGSSATPVPVTALERTLPSSVDLGTSFLPTTTALSSTQLEDLAVQHDKARFLYEVIAAKSTGSERTEALARRDIHAQRSESLAALAGDPDGRQSLYNVSPLQVETAAARGAAATATEFALGARYVAMLPDEDATDRGWLLNAAFDAYAAGSLQRGFTVAQFPALPGIQAAG